MSESLAAHVEGSGDDILLLHGQPGDAADWAGVTRLLAPRHRVIAPDRPGYGRTGGRAVGIRENAQAVARLLDELGAGPVVAAGHSFGAGVALALAQLHPVRVNRLVLICPVTPEDRLGLADRLLASRRVGAATARIGFAAAGWGLAREGVQRWIGRVLPGLDTERLPDIARSWLHGSVWKSFYREQRALFDELPGFRDGLARFAVPTTVVIASHDRITDPEAGRAFAAAVGAQLVEVPRAGHMLPMQAPDEVAAAIGAKGRPW